MVEDSGGLLMYNTLLYGCSTKLAPILKYILIYTRRLKLQLTKCPFATVMAQLNMVKKALTIYSCQNSA